MPSLRGAEWINLVAFLSLTLLAHGSRELDRVRRGNITAIGSAGLLLTLFTAVAVPHLAPPLAASIIRDWIPYLLLVLVYWQCGQFVTHADTALEGKLERLDRRLVVPLLEGCARFPAGAAIFAYLELAYMSYYVALPAALAALYLSGRRREADHFWIAVLVAAYVSCGTLPFVQTRPPRLLGEKWSVPLPSGKLRAFNLWILRRGSIQANTCPSAHVAIATSCALMLLHTGPLPLGILFLLIAVSIALGAVAGRYHYAADAILGALVGGAAAVFTCLVKK